MARPSAVALLSLVLAAAGASTASAAGWSQPFRLAAPARRDVVPAAIAFSTTGEATVAFGIQDADAPASSSAYAMARSAGGKLTSPRQIPGAQRVLDVAYNGPSAELLLGTSPQGVRCCSSVWALGSNRGGAVGAPTKLVGNLAGAAVGRFVAVPGGVLAAIATERGVWVSQSVGANPFGVVQRITAPSQLPAALDATSLQGGESVVAWTGRGRVDAKGPRTIFIATGSPAQPPAGARAAINVPPGHRIDELALGRGFFVPTIAWIESWFDSGGLYHSQAVVAGLGAVVRPRPLSSAAELASGLALTADARGDQALSWKTCTTAGACAVHAALRSADRRFGQDQELGSIDASQSAAVTIAPTGEALLGWISQGHVLAAQARPGAGQFAAPRTVSLTNFAADLSLAFGPAGHALAVWTQGTLAQAVMAAVYSTH